jgi:hypothetical protein
MGGGAAQAENGAIERVRGSAPVILVGALVARARGLLGRAEVRARGTDHEPRTKLTSRGDAETRRRGIGPPVRLFSAASAPPRDPFRARLVERADGLVFGSPSERRLEGSAPSEPNGRELLGGEVRVHPRGDRSTSPCVVHAQAATPSPHSRRGSGSWVGWIIQESRVGTINQAGGRCSVSAEVLGKRPLFEARSGRLRRSLALQHGIGSWVGSMIYASRSASMNRREVVPHPAPRRVATLSRRTGEGLGVRGGSWRGSMIRASCAGTSTRHGARCSGRARQEGSGSGAQETQRPTGAPPSKAGWP